MDEMQDALCTAVKSSLGKYHRHGLRGKVTEVGARKDMRLVSSHCSGLAGVDRAADYDIGLPRLLKRNL